MKVIEANVATLDVRYSRLRVTDRRREKQLMASLEEHGQQDAISVVAGGEGQFIVIDGHARVRALRRLRRDVVRAVVLNTGPAEALAMVYREGLARSYNAIEEGWLLHELHRVWKWDLGKAAASMGRSRSWASRRLGLVEVLPDTVLEGVRCGKLGAWSAMKHLLPLARANTSACERLAGKIAEVSLSSRQAALVCEHFTKSGAQVRERILEDPTRFLKALAASGDGPQDLALSEAENRALKQLDLVGNVALGLTRGLPSALGYDAGEVARGKLWWAWERTAKRWSLLEETVAALKAARKKNREEGNAQPGNEDGCLDASQTGSRQPKDSEGLEGGAQCSEGSDRQRPGGGGTQARTAASAGAVC